MFMKLMNSKIYNTRYNYINTYNHIVIKFKNYYYNIFYYLLLLLGTLCRSLFGMSTFILNDTITFFIFNKSLYIFFFILILYSA